MQARWFLSKPRSTVIFRTLAFVFTLITPSVSFKSITSKLQYVLLMIILPDIFLPSALLERKGWSVVPYLDSTVTC